MLPEVWAIKRALMCLSRLRDAFGELAIYFLVFAEIALAIRNGQIVVTLKQSQQEGIDNVWFVD